jgi:hypothetical protein
MNLIPYSTMVRNLAKPGEAILETLTPSKCHLIHMLFGLAGEVMEFQDAVYRDNKTDIGEEGGDIIFYAQGILNMYDMDLSITPTHHFPSVQRVMYSLIIHTEHVLDLAKKHLMYTKELPDSLFIDEIHNMIRQVLYVGRSYGLTFKDFQDLNMKKLLTGKNARYAEGSYSDEAAQARSDKQIAESTVSIHTELVAEVSPEHLKNADDEPGEQLEDDPPGEDLQDDGPGSEEESDEESDSDEDEDFDPPGDRSLGTGL